MQMVNSDQELSNVEFRFIFVKFSFLSQMQRKVPAGTEIQNHIEILWSLDVYRRNQ